MGAQYHRGAVGFNSGRGAGLQLKGWWYGGACMRKRKVNARRRLLAPLDPGALERLQSLSQRARYGGNPDHKRNPGDFGLTPPSNPRPAKSLCDDAGIVSRAEAERVLRRGLALGLVSEQARNGWPQNVWGVAANGTPVEAMLDNEQQGTYHGYPMLPEDPLVDEVLERWTP